MLRLNVMALGSVPKGLLEAAASEAARTFQLDWALAPPLAEPTYAFNPSREQYHAAAIVRKLEKLKRSLDGIVLGVCNLDLFDPDGEHVFVDADREVQTCVLGLARLASAGEQRLLQRVGHAGLVAVGRAIGLRECDDARCAMATISTAGSLDKRNGRLCLPCETALAKGERAWAKS